MKRYELIQRANELNKKIYDTQQDTVLLRMHIREPTKNIGYNVQNIYIQKIKFIIKDLGEKRNAVQEIAERLMAIDTLECINLDKIEKEVDRIEEKTNIAIKIVTGIREKWKELCQKIYGETVAFVNKLKDENFKIINEIFEEYDKLT